MVSNRLGLAVIGLASIVAAGAGGYVAMRQTDRHPVMAASAPAQALTAPAPVQETEAAVVESSSASGNRGSPGGRIKSTRASSGGCAPGDCGAAGRPVTSEDRTRRQAEAASPFCSHDETAIDGPVRRRRVTRVLRRIRHKTR